jgi:hypothetical protein
MHEPWIERVIREAQEAGKFDDVAGSGAPIPDLGRPYDPAWWARRWIASERRRQRKLELIRRIDRELPRLLAGTVEHEIRAGLESLNNLIEGHNGQFADGNVVPLLDVAALMNERASRCGDWPPQT